MYTTQWHQNGTFKRITNSIGFWNFEFQQVDHNFIGHNYVGYNFMRHSVYAIII